MVTVKVLNHQVWIENFNTVLYKTGPDLETGFKNHFNQDLHISH